MYDCIIVGAGPAGTSAALYAVRSQLKTLILAQAVPPALPEPGFTLIGFKELLSQLQESIAERDSISALHTGEAVRSVEKNVVSFSVETASGKLYYARSVIVASGAADGQGNSSFDVLTIKDSRGRIKVDENLRSSVPEIFAAGDVAATMTSGMAAAIAEGAKAALSVKILLTQ